MPGGFWIFLLIVVANLVITIIKKTAEKRSKAAGSSDEGAPERPAAPAPRRFKGEGDHEMVLERTGDHRIGVVDILRRELRWDLPTAMTLAGTTPSVVATGLTRSEAGYLRNRFESIGAGVSVRRKAAESVSTARDLDLERRPALEALAPPASPARMQIRADGGDDLSNRRVESLRRRRSEATPPRPSPPPPREPGPRSTRRPTTPVVTPELAAKAELPDLPAPRAARAASRRPEAVKEPGEVDTGPALGRRIRKMTRDRRSLREAFLLQELLRPPLSLRSSGSGGRDS